MQSDNGISQTEGDAGQGELLTSNENVAKLTIGDTEIVDTFAEAFDMRFARLLLTAADDYWLDHAIREFSGYSASVLACDAECGLDRMATATEPPDGRPGAFVLAFGFSKKALQKAVANRVGQCVMTCPTTAVFDGLPDSETRAPLGKQIRYFGDGFQKSKQVAGVRYWRIPVMDGEFVIEESFGVGKGVAGGNFILQGESKSAALAAARRAAEAVRACQDIIAPFPGGVARSGSKVGSRYKGLPASTSDAYCRRSVAELRASFTPTPIVSTKSSSTACRSTRWPRRWSSASKRPPTTVS